MISGRLSSRREFTQVPSYDSVFVYMIPTQNVMPARVIPARVHPASCAGVDCKTVVFFATTSDGKRR